MNTEELDQALHQTLNDGRLSRAERQALLAVLGETPLDAAGLSQLRARAFVLARERTTDLRALQALGWVEDLMKLLVQVDAPAAASSTRAYFSPGEACLSEILGQLGRTRRTADICVFTITDDRIARAILDAQARKVLVRVITDNDKQYDGGSDIARLRGAGVAVKVDETEHHMHHKFAVLDGAVLLNGSYNWTRSAGTFNEENLIASSEPGLVQAFARQFAELWEALGH